MIIDKRKVIVVVDEEENIRDLFSIILSSAGYKVVPIDYAPESLSLNVQPDLLLIDVSLQNYDIERFYYSIKADPNTSDIPVILTSTNNNIVEKASQWKAKHYISKPFDISDLIKKVGEILN